MSKRSLVITSIANDKHPVLNTFARECTDRKIPFILIGDTKSPGEFNLPGCDFYSIERQRSLNFKFAHLVPEKHYARKNIGYLVAIENGCDEIMETDDDNYPREGFWFAHEPEPSAHHLENTGWLNIYRYFTEKMIWPRGYPLEELQKALPELGAAKKINCPIQQGLADENPDVDAIYRLTYPLPLSFEKSNNLALGKNAWSPFNSQNTYWYKQAFALLYLPSYCSFRMTDIWRSYVAQRIAWENDWSVYYHSPTVWQERNEHSLMKDFQDEISGYTQNFGIAKALADLQLKKGKENIYDNLLKCYTRLAEMNVVGKEEIPLLEAWINDLSAVI